MMLHSVDGSSDRESQVRPAVCNSMPQKVLHIYAVNFHRRRITVFIDASVSAHFYAPQLYRQVLLRRVLAMAILSVCLSVRHNPVPNQAQVR